MKIRVAVIFGGRSGEHEVSLASAESVMQNLDRTRYEVIPVGITREGRWLLNGDSDEDAEVRVLGRRGARPADGR